MEKEGNEMKGNGLNAITSFYSESKIQLALDSR